MSFAENLKLYREKKKISGKDFAKQLSIPYPTYMSYENKGREPKFDLLVKIAQILGVTTDELLGNNQLSCVNIIRSMLQKDGFEISNTENEVLICIKVKVDKEIYESFATFDQKDFVEYFDRIVQKCDNERNEKLYYEMKNSLIGILFPRTKLPEDFTHPFKEKLRPISHGITNLNHI